GAGYLGAAGDRHADPYLGPLEAAVAGPRHVHGGARTWSDARCPSGGGVSRSYALFEVAEPSAPLRITEAPAHVGRAGRAGVVLIDFSSDRRGHEIWHDRRRRCRARIRARGAGQGP